MDENFFINLLQLKKLDISQNKLTKISPSISNYIAISLLGACEKLLEVNYSQNKISEFPIEMAQLPKIEIIDCSYNEINELPKEGWMNNKLRNLNLEQNYLTDIPKELLRDTALDNLKLGRNQLNKRKIVILNNIW